MVSRLSYTSDKTRDIGDYLDKSLRSLERQKAILEGAEDVETRRKALAAIGSQSAVLARHLAPAATRGAPAARETVAVIRAAQGVPKPSGAAPAGDPLSAVLTLIIALTALKRKWRRPPAA